MGILEAGVVYKAVDEVDLSPRSTEVYLRANVKGPHDPSLSIVFSIWFSGIQ